MTARLFMASQKKEGAASLKQIKGNNLSWDT